MVFPTFFNLSLNLAIRSSWSEPHAAPSLVFADCIELLYLWLQKYSQSAFNIDHLVMSMCRVFSCVVGRGCLLWPVSSLGRTPLAFALLHSTFQGQICLLLQVFLDFLLLHSSPLQFYITWGEIITVYSFYKLFTNIVKDHIFRKPMLYYRQLVFKLFCLGFTK